MFQEHLNEVFNRIEALLREVLKSQKITRLEKIG